MTRIIRAPERTPRKPNPEGPRLVRAAEKQAAKQGTQLLDQARARAAALLAEARAEAEKQRQVAVQAGQAQAAALLAVAQQQAAAITRQAEGDLTRLAVRIAEKLLGEQLQLSPESVTLIVRQCLARASASRRITLRVHPDDLALVERALPRLAQACESDLLRPQADPTLARGDCVLETDQGEIDGRLQIQLQAIEEALRS